MIETPQKKLDPEKEATERAAFTRAVAACSTREYSKDAYFFLLIDPDIRELQRTAAEAVRSQRFGDSELTFRGFRGTKLLDPATRTTRSILWPSFCWVHGQIQPAAKAFRSFQQVGGDDRFYFDEDNRRFSSTKLKKIMDWMQNVETAPYDPKAPREGGHEPR